MPALKPDHIYVTDEEDAAITAAALSDPDNPPLDDLSGFIPAREFFSPEEFAALTDKNNPVKFVPVPDPGPAPNGKRSRGRPPLESTKECIALRLDEDLLTRLRASGRGWQTRINAVLREAVEAGRL